jgi:hypothetical protein
MLSISARYDSSDTLRIMGVPSTREVVDVSVCTAHRLCPVDWTTSSWRTWKSAWTRPSTRSMQCFRPERVRAPVLFLCAPHPHPPLSSSGDSPGLSPDPVYRCCGPRVHSLLLAGACVSGHRGRRVRCPSQAELPRVLAPCQGRGPVHRHHPYGQVSHDIFFVGLVAPDDFETRT